MTVGFPPPGRTIPPATADHRPRSLTVRRGADADATAGSSAADAAADVAALALGDVSELPPAPPPEVLAEVREAARCAQRLYEQGRELRFERDDRGIVCAVLCDLRGGVIRQLPLAEVLDVARGAEVG